MIIITLIIAIVANIPAPLLMLLLAVVVVLIVSMLWGDSTMHNGFAKWSGSILAVGVAGFIMWVKIYYNIGV